MQKQSSIRALSQARCAATRRRTVHPPHESTIQSSNYDPSTILDNDNDNESFILKDRES